MSLVILAVRLALAGLLLAAGLEKARGMAGFMSTLSRLGMTERAARVAAPLLIAAEIAAALGLIFRPHSPVTLSGVLVLGGVFAIAGATALRRDEQIRCACLGSYGDSVLGMRQLAALPLWLAAVVLLWLRPYGDAFDVSAAAYFAAVALTLALVRAITALAAAREARGDRRSATEMLVWLRR
jgi:hypothetical protein